MRLHWRAHYFTRNHTAKGSRGKYRVRVQPDGTRKLFFNKELLGDGLDGDFAAFKIGQAHEDRQGAGGIRAYLPPAVRPETDRNEIFGKREEGSRIQVWGMMPRPSFVG